MAQHSNPHILLQYSSLNLSVTSTELQATLWQGVRKVVEQAVKGRAPQPNCWVHTVVPTLKGNGLKMREIELSS